MFVRQPGKPRSIRSSLSLLSDGLRNFTADRVIDLGPEGGDGGGRVVAEGRPEDIAKAPESYTNRQNVRPISGATVH